MPKIGKTTLATRFPKHLLCGFEKGYSALPGIMAVPINTWAEFLQVLNQLKTDKKKYDVATAKGEEYELMYQTIIVDIADIAYDLCEKYILAQNQVSKIGEIPFGAGYGMLAKEFDEKLRLIPQMGYGLILISHEKLLKNEDNEDLKYSTCSLASRPKSICTRLVDVYGYISVDNTADGTVHTLHVRQSPAWEAGTRFKYMQESIPLNYASLVKAIGMAVDKEQVEMEDHNLVVDSFINNYAVPELPLFSQVKNSISDLIEKIMGKATANGNTDEVFERISQIISKYLGENVKVAQAKETQIEHLILIEDDLKALV